ncbi:MAG TPA: hypothetical protein EYQ74_04770, partial [Planctomycetes bacterium]|nr:hypothetical protein [Planctomycetota bacterium]
MKNFWKDDVLISCAADPITLSVKLNRFRTLRILNLCGGAVVALLGIPGMLAGGGLGLLAIQMCGGLALMLSAGFWDIQIKPLLLI